MLLWILDNDVKMEKRMLIFVPMNESKHKEVEASLQRSSHLESGRGCGGKLKHFCSEFQFSRITKPEDWSLGLTLTRYILPR